MFQLKKEEWNSLRCQTGTSKKGRGGQRYMPFAFIKLREFLASQKDLTKEVIELKSFVLKHTHKTDQEFRKVWQAIEKLCEPPTREERKIGFNTS